MSETTPPKAHAERGHHPYGPSGLNNLAASPCFLNRQSTNEAAERGTRQHESVERGEDDPALEDAEADAVRRAMTMVASAKELLTNAGKTVHEFTEQYLPIDDVVVDGWRGTSGGYPDKVLIYESAPGEFYAYVMDWKFGRYAVTPAEYNMQGHAYMLGVRHLLTTGELGGLRGTLKAGTVVFFSPHRGDEPSHHEFTETDFGRMYAAIVDTVAHARIVRAEIDRTGGNLNAVWPKGYFRRSVSTCAFCARVAECPAIKELVSRIYARYKPAEPPVDLNGVSESDPEALASGLQVAGVVATWAKAYRERVTNRAFEEPEKCTPKGYKLIATYPAQVVKSAELLAELRTRFGDEKVFEHVKAPLTPFDKLVSSSAPRGTKEAAVEAFRESLKSAGLIEDGSKPTVSLRMS